MASEKQTRKGSSRISSQFTALETQRLGKMPFTGQRWILKHKGQITQRPLYVTYTSKAKTNQKNMAKYPLLPLFLSILHIAIAANSAATSAATNFIQASCRDTTYPALCVQSLSMYATSIQRSPRQLAQTALTVSLAKAESTMTFVYKLTKFKGVKAREMAALKDCLEEVGDTVDRLSKSVKELKKFGQAKGEDFQWHMSNVETWVSAALTDENTCVDGFAGKALDGKMKTSIKARIVTVAQVTSNALALINKYASKQ